MPNAYFQRLLTAPDGLATLLRNARQQSGLKGESFTGPMNITAPRMSDYENGRRVPPEDIVRQWANLTGADVDQLINARERALRQRQSWAVRLAGGQRENQEAFVRLGETTSHVWAFDLNLVVGEAQTVSYASSILTQSSQLHRGHVDQADIATAVEARRSRRDMMRTRPDKTFSILIGEGALRTGIVEPAAMIEQCRMVTELDQLPNVTVGVIPQMTPVVLFPHGSFTGYDDQVVMTEPAPGPVAYDQPDDLALFRHMFDLWANDPETRFGDDLTELVDQVIADWGRFL